MEFQTGKEKKKTQRGDNLEIGLKGREIILNKEKTARKEKNDKEEREKEV